MSYTTFNVNEFDATKEPMFLGQSVNIARYDVQKYQFFEKLTEKQLSFFWRPEEVDLSRDGIDFSKMSPEQQHIFISNLKYQTLLDSVQGRSPNLAFLSIVSLPELETWFETWSFSETIHSRSYTHILRNIVNDPSLIFDNIININEIQERARSVTRHYDALINKSMQWVMGADRSDEAKFELYRSIYKTLFAANMLEGVRFYISFACTFAFAEQSIMEGNAKIMKLIARDEALHMTGTQTMINLIRNGSEGELFQKAAESCHNECMQIAYEVAAEEKRWAEYLFSRGSMLGLNRNILSQYIDHLMTVRLSAIGYPYDNPLRSNPLPWMNNWLTNDSVQVAPQESEISSYLVGQVDANVSSDDFNDIDL